LYVQQNWTIDFGSDIPSYFNMELFGFTNEYYQNASTVSGGSLSYTQETDQYGNNLLQFHLTPTSEFETVELDSVVDVNYFPFDSPSEPAPIQQYVQPTNLTSYDATMYGQAQTIVAGAASDMDKLVRITDFVHNWVTYAGPGFGNQIYNATYTYYAQEGYCGDYAHLEIALLKAVGIPARFDAGIVCSDNCTTSSTNWGAHGWVEAYVDGQWVSADPTFGEAIELDATHAKYYQGADQSEFQEQYSAPAGYPLQQVISSINQTMSVSVDYWYPPTPQFSLSVTAPNATVGVNSLEQIFSAATSNASFPLGVPLSLLAPSELSLRTDRDGLLLLNPGQTGYFNWTAVTPTDLQAGYQYTYPLNVQSLGQSASANLTATLNGKSVQQAGVEVQSVSSAWNSDNTQFLLSFVLENNGNVDSNINATLDYYNYSLNLTLPLPAGVTQTMTYSIPAGQLTDPNGISGNLTVQYSGQQEVYPFTISFMAPPSPAMPQLPSVSQISGLDQPGLPLVLAFAIIIILVLALLLFKQS
jgi:transglutaminase-like putative cysteine protease